MGGKPKPSKGEIAFRAFGTYWYVGLTAMLLSLAYLNLDSAAFWGSFLAAAVVLSVVFLRVTGWARTGKIVTVALALGTAAMMAGAFSLDGLPSFGTASAIRILVPNLAAGPPVGCHGSPAPGGYSGTWIYRDLDSGATGYNGVTKDTAADIAVVVYYRYGQYHNAGTYVDEKTGQKVTNAQVRDVTVSLVDVATWTCFAQKTFSTNPAATLGQNQSPRFSASAFDGTVIAYIKGFFR